MRVVVAIAPCCCVKVKTKIWCTHRCGAAHHTDHKQGKQDNNEVVVLKPKHFQAMIMPMIEESHERIKSLTHDHQKWDDKIENSVNHDQGMMLKEGLIFYDNRIYVPCNQTLQGEIITQFHDHIMAGHPGIAKTKELVLQEYWWPKMKKDVEAYVCACKTCQQTKASTQAKRALLHPNKIPDHLWTHISVDMVTGLPMCQGYNVILVIVDCFSKEIIPVVCSTKLLSEGWAKILYDQVYAKHGMPQVVISDRGPQFVSNFLKDLYKLLNIKSNASTAFHLQTDSQTE